MIFPDFLGSVSDYMSPSYTYIVLNDLMDCLTSNTHNITLSANVFRKLAVLFSVCSVFTHEKMHILAQI